MNKKENLDPMAVQLISNGSLIGIGIGTFLTSLFCQTFIGVLVGSVLLTIGYFSMKSNWYLVKMDD